MMAPPVSSAVNKALTAAVMLAVVALVSSGCSGTDTPLNNNNQNNGSYRCPSGYILVPGGTFTVGVDEEEVADLEVSWSPGMGPAHKVTLTSDFCMSKTEITVAEYRQCRTSGGCTGDGPWPVEQDGACNFSDTDQSRDHHPVNCLTWPQAREYCQAQGGDLPSEAQWTRAAQGDDRRHYPWGNGDPTCSRANWDVNGPPALEENGFGCAETKIPPYTWPVGSAPAGASPYGVQDLAGNVDEFLLDCLGPFDTCDGELGCVDPFFVEECASSTLRYIRGGSYFGIAVGMFIFHRTGSGYDRKHTLGMRCVVASAGK